MNIHTSIKVISSSIKDRGSKQGEKVFTAALEQLTELDSTEDRASFLNRLNKALNGMEAHGKFTDEEYQVVCFLREKEQVIDKLDSFLKNNKELIDENEVGVYIALRERMLE